MAHCRGALSGEHAHRGHGDLLNHPVAPVHGGGCLSHLAQQLINVDKMSLQAWCALINCLSLQKEHQTAIKVLPACT